MIETVGALVVITIALSGIMFAITQGSTVRIDPLLASRARWLASEKLENIIADRHSATRGYDYLSSANYPAENPVPGNGTFNRSVQFAETGPDLQTSGEGYMMVAVSVAWLDSSGTPRTLAVSTVLTEYN